MNSRALGLLIVTAGLALVVIGLLVLAGGFGWFGRLPGDIRYERGNVRVYAPVVSMLLASVVLSLVLYVIRRFF